MKTRHNQATRLSQRQTWKRIALVSSMAVVVTAFVIFISQNLHPEKVYAATCENGYTLNWGDTSTWDITCGTVNAGNWSVKGKTCWYFSPLFTVSGSASGPMRELTINVRINQSGNL